MNVSDAMLALALAAKIHGTDAAVAATAKRCAQRMPHSKRFLMSSVVESNAPLELVTLLLTDQTQWRASQQLQVNAW